MDERVLMPIVSHDRTRRRVVAAVPGLGLPRRAEMKPIPVLAKIGTLAVRRVMVIVVLALGCAACGSHSSASGPSGSGIDLLIALNASFNDGRTVRWAALPIPVFLNGIARADEVSAWAVATGGAVTFAFVGSPPPAGIAFRFGGGNDVCGSTLVEYESDGRITSVDIQVVQGIFRGPQCQRTVVHETGHAIGFLAHTGDGGLMDPDGGNGEITPDDVTFIRSLYSLAPGTFVGLGERTRVALARSRGRRSVMIVDPVRR
jgi:hypothetical protein